ncbi:unnamed protein product [Polarella glacialis]|uniref:Phospholipase/carboxylesterase/thioesterase domain-containing protein n=1 Tax=Polarella glacialis TaxID=89957 RepID=A0A813L4S6_POLGL|nr:unnamed protein product [Polarella glacialis]
MTSWFDITTWRPPGGIGLAEPDKPAGLEASVKVVHKALEAAEKAGVPSDRIVIGGFSQGGVVALLAGLSYPRKLGGIASISGWATYRDDLASKINPANAAVPCIFCSGTGDPVVEFALSKKSGEVLESALGESVSVMQVKRSEHGPHPSEMQAVQAFMIKCLG